MAHQLWDEQKEADLLEQINLELKEAVRYAEQAPFPAAESTLLHVYGENA